MNAGMHWTWAVHMLLLVVAITMGADNIAGAISANTKAVKVATECKP